MSRLASEITKIQKVDGALSTYNKARTISVQDHPCVCKGNLISLSRHVFHLSIRALSLLFPFFISSLQQNYTDKKFPSNAYTRNPRCPVCDLSKRNSVSVPPSFRTSTKKRPAWLAITSLLPSRSTPTRPNLRASFPGRENANTPNCQLANFDIGRGSFLVFLRGFQRE